MKFGLNNHFNIIKYNQSKPQQPISIPNIEKDHSKNLVSSFRNTIIKTKISNSNYKTSKNSPDKFYFEKSKNIKNKINQINHSNINNNNYNKINLNSNIILNNNKSNEKNIDNLLRRKIIKIKEKKAITMGNTFINNSSNYINQSLNYNITSGNFNNYLPYTNYNKKIKSKITLETKNKIAYSNYQKRINSSIEDDEKNSYTNSSRDTFLIPKNLSSSSSKHKGILHTNFNTIQNKQNNLILQSHLKNKNTAIFNSTIHSIYKNKIPNKSPKYKLNIHVNSKTSFPTQNNSRKNSKEKIAITNINNSNSNKNIHPKANNNINNYFRSPLNQREEKNNNDDKYKPCNQKALINVGKIKMNDSSKSVINSKSNSKEQSKNNSKENILKKTKIPEKKITVLESLLHSNINKDNNVCISESYNTGKIIVMKNNFHKNNVINVDEVKKNENEIIEKNKNDNSENNTIKVNKTNGKNKENIIQKDKNEKELNEKIKNTKIESKINYFSPQIEKEKIEKVKKEKKTPKKEKKSPKKEKETETSKEKREKKEKNKIPDHDIETSENLKDTLLYYLNANIDIIPNQNSSNLNESTDSYQSITKDSQKNLSYLKDKEIISSYIKEYFSKNGNYPSTKMKFYKYGRLLGKGAFGKVNLSLHILTGRLVAIKSINKTKITTERQKSKIQIETSIMKTLSKSDHIVKMFETYETQKHICIVMEYICAGDLLSYIRKRSKLNEQIAKYIFKQIILGLQFIHNHNIVHRDIKLDNILIDLDNKIKICDFGVSKRVVNNDKMFDHCGTPTYIAPEILRNKGYEGYGVDVWSSGVVLYAMLSGTVPFKGNDLNELHDVIMKGSYKEIKDISNEASHLLKCILEVDPRKRISVNDILFHPWLIDVDVNNFSCYNLFTNAERILLAKSNVDYRDIRNKDDMIENFNIRNLDTEEESENKNVNTKSLILAPFNSSYIINDESQISLIDNINEELFIKNNIIKFSVKVKELNRIYELNNNGEIDNGVVISMDTNEKKYYNNISPSPYNNGSFYSKGQSKPFSPNNELDDNFNKKDIKDKEKDISENALNELAKLGYLKPYVRECLHNNEKNYATASYFLLVKYCN